MIWKELHKTRDFPFKVAVNGKYKWTSEKRLPTARHALALGSIDNKIYVIGGSPQPDGFGTTINREINEH